MRTKQVPLGDNPSFWDRFNASKKISESWLWSASTAVCVDALSSGSALGAPLSRLFGRAILVVTNEQLSAALALVELDGIARRLVLCPPDLSVAVLPWIVSTASIDTLVCDENLLDLAIQGVERISIRPRRIIPRESCSERTEKTEWILLTSGTTGVPKLVSHTLSTLSGALSGKSNFGMGSAWATFYDIRRFGGLQILLRALLGGGSMVLSQASESTSAFLARATSHRVTHISGTPSHWRRALLCEASTGLDPIYIRLSGEIADQTILDRLRAAFPRAQITHSFASTEAGVAFDVEDGRAGFPASWVDCAAAPVRLKVRDGTLRIKSNRAARQYVGTGARTLFDDQGFVDTADMVELRGDRYYFVGRKDGMINVGGLKVHPEEIESVVSIHPAVRISRATARNSRLVGSVVAVDVVADLGANESIDAAKTLKQEILQLCVARLPRHKVPATIRFVQSIDLNAAGKVVR
jgi:acyl-CoA synthetase (AMP-forming)/AMP-acid ligase II